MSQEFLMIPDRQLVISLRVYLKHTKYSYIKTYSCKHLLKNHWLKIG